MFKDSKTFSSFSVNDISAAVQFYREVLGLNVEETSMGVQLHLANDEVFIYSKGEAHAPASHTVLNFMVDDIDGAVDYLVGKGVSMEHVDAGPAQTDSKGILRPTDPSQGPTIAWFKDPAGNTLSVLQQ